MLFPDTPAATTRILLFPSRSPRVSLPPMKFLRLFRPFAATAIAGMASLTFTSCAAPAQKTAGRSADGRTFDVPAYRATNPRNVRVKASVNHRAVYVLEGDKPLLVTPANFGAPGHGTPLGNHRAYARIRNKRSMSYGKYPMPFWVEFRPGYGFHGGWVHAVNKSHGCVRLPWNVAPKFWELVPLGTPINVAPNQPEDLTLGKNIPRLNDATAPEWPQNVLWTDRVFHITDGRKVFEN